MIRSKPILRDRQDAEPACYCENCKGEVYAGEARFRWAGRLLCRDCFRCAVRLVLWEDPEQIAQEMGLEVERYE